MIRNTSALAQIESLKTKVDEFLVSEDKRPLIKDAFVCISPNLEVKIDHLNWREFLNLETTQLQFTVSKIVELAQEKFFDDLCIRFGANQETLYQHLKTTALHRGASRSEVLGSLRDRRIEVSELQVLRDLSEGMVQRIAEIYGLLPSKITRQTQSLSVSNVRDFLGRIEQEAYDVYGVYLGDGRIQEQYRLLISNEPPLEEIIRFANEELAQARIDVHVPIEGRDEDRPHFAEVMSLELVTAHLIYKLPTVSQEERDQVRIKLYIRGYGMVNYRVHSEIDLWSGLIAYRFCAVEELEAPDIVAVRGTQRRTDLGGFLASMISIWHPLGPGGNALIGVGAQKLEEMMRRDGKKVIVSGHSMGAEIAVALAKKTSIQSQVERTYSFNNPGRNKHHMNVETPASKVHHFVNASDPIAYLGDFRDGRVNLIYSPEMPIPQNFRQMMLEAPSLILNNHCIPQTLGKRSWMAVELRAGTSIGAFNPVWGFLHRLVSNTLYGPWKMVATISWVVYPLFQRFASWTSASIQKIYVWAVVPVRTLLSRSIENRAHPIEPQAST